VTITHDQRYAGIISDHPSDDAEASAATNLKIPVTTSWAPSRMARTRIVQAICGSRYGTAGCLGSLG
jgi:hypothetical protein